MTVRAQEPRVEIILVKYNRPDMEADTIRHVLDTAGYENYSLRAHLARRGDALSKTWNRLIDQSDADLICLLNTDTIPTQDWLRDMVDIMQSEGVVGAVVPSSNRVHLSQIEVPFEDWEVNTEIIQDFADVLAEGVGERLSDLPTCSAMCVLFPKKVWSMLGGFDEEFTFYGEDTHFFYRMIQELRLSVVWARKVYVHHLGSQSFIQAHNDGELDYADLRKRAGSLWFKKKAEVDERVRSRNNI